MTRTPHPYGTNDKPAHAHVGPPTGPDGPDEPAHSHGANGFPASRAHAPVGPAVGPNGSENVSHGVTGQSGQIAGAGVRPKLDGNTDTRGLVPEDERVHLQVFGADVRTLRKAAGLTQEQLGKLAGIGTTHISRLEQGRRRPSVDAIKALARILAPSGTTEAVEQRLGTLAGDSLREGAARRKRQAENKHRKAAAAEMARFQRKMGRLVADRECRGVLVDDSLRRMASRDLAERLQPFKDDPGITGIEPVRSRRDPREEVRELIRSMKRGRR